LGTFSCIQQRAYVASLMAKKEKKMRRGGALCHGLESNFHVSEVSLCQSVHEIGFFRVVKGPKYTQENKLPCFTCKVKP
jgi:hypothetical protein